MPTMWASGVHGVFDYLVIDLLGPSLDNLYRQNNRIMDLRSVLSIGMQVVSYLFHLLPFEFVLKDYSCHVWNSCTRGEYFIAIYS